MKRIQLVAPAGNIEKLSASLNSGADTVFLGGKILSMSTGTHSFSDEELVVAVKLAEEKGKKIQVLLNAVPHNEDIEKLPDYVKFLESIGIKEVLVSDMGVFQCVREFSNMDIIVATHSSNTNWRSVEMWKKLGAKKVVLDRDLSIEGIAEIRNKVQDIELEIFMHGAILLAISGRKILNNYMQEHKIDKNSESENFSLVEEKRPNEHMPIYEDKYGTYIYGARDLCAIESLEKLLTLGINSIRIDGGMKDIDYLTTAIEVYKKAITSFESGNYVYDTNWKEELQKRSQLPFVNWYEKNFEKEVEN
ncbi:MAG: peptidase U32 family protein [Fusobacteriaceae bacterium]